MAQEEELRGKAKLAFEACLKIFHGQKMASEGTFELNNLFGEHSLKKKPKAGGGQLTPGQKSALTKGKKLIPHVESNFKKDKRSDETLMNKMVELVRTNRQASTILFKKKLHLSDRRLNKLLGTLTGKGILADESSGEEGAHHKWVLVKEPEKKAINGHKLAKTPGGGGKRKLKRNPQGYKTLQGTHGQIDVTDEKIMAKAKEFLKTEDWVTKGKLLDVIDLSSSAGNRFIAYAKKQKIIKEVHKKNNPAHDKDGLRKFHSRSLPYVELA